jgi:uncharacterized protein (DUF1330 family)
MSAYVIVQAEVADWDRFKKYLNETPRTIAQYGAKYIVRGGEWKYLKETIKAGEW